MFNDRSINDQLFKIDKEIMLNTICKIENELNALSDLDLDSIKKEDTVIIIVDMINGFAKEGSLSSPRVNQLIPRISALLSSEKVINKVFICDAHPVDSVEFQSYPEHAVVETFESKIVGELMPYIDLQTVVINKNSTNALETEAFRLFLSENSNISNFIVIGDCTDICILQCALGLKAHFNETNISKRVLVPCLYVDTYDLDVNHHHGDLMNLFAMYNMKINGVELYKDIIF